MGIRFKCHLCLSPLNVKNDLAKKRGVCPKCSGKFRIPIESQDYSLSLDSPVSYSTKAISELDSEVFETHSIAERPSKAAPGLKIASESTSQKETPQKETPQKQTIQNQTGKPTEKPTEEKKIVQEPTLLKPAVQDLTNREPSENEETPSESDELYFVRPPSGGEYGPADKATIELWVTQRRITSETLICKLGASQWKKARDVFAELFLLG